LCPNSVKSLKTIENTATVKSSNLFTSASFKSLENTVFSRLLPFFRQFENMVKHGEKRHKSVSKVCQKKEGKRPLFVFYF
jgi:hypothetical protein